MKEIIPAIAIGGLLAVVLGAMLSETRSPKDVVLKSAIIPPFEQESSVKAKCECECGSGLKATKPESSVDKDE